MLSNIVVVVVVVVEFQVSPIYMYHVPCSIYYIHNTCTIYTCTIYYIHVPCLPFPSQFLCTPLSQSSKKLTDRLKLLTVTFTRIAGTCRPVLIQQKTAKKANVCSLLPGQTSFYGQWSILSTVPFVSERGPQLILKVFSPSITIWEVQDLNIIICHPKGSDSVAAWH